MGASRDSFDFDWLVIGSGFGGSVSALRLSEKGYSVGVLECGRRFADDEFPRATADLKRYFWNPRAGYEGHLPADDVQGCVGRLRLRRRRRQPRLREHAVCAAEGILRGSPVGGHVRLGERPGSPLRRGPADARRRGKPATRTPPTSCCASSARSSASGTPTNARPWASSSASRARPCPTRTSAARGPIERAVTLCGRCMVGCPHGAKNTLVKNYLYFAEKLGARVMPERTVLDIRPLGSPDGSDGLRGRKRPLGRVAAQGPPCPARTRRGRLGRPARHEQAVAALPH